MLTSFTLGEDGEYLIFPRGGWLASFALVEGGVFAGSRHLSTDGALSTPCKGLLRFAAASAAPSSSLLMAWLLLLTALRGSFPCDRRGSFAWRRSLMRLLCLGTAFGANPSPWGSSRRCSAASRWRLVGPPFALRWWPGKLLRLVAGAWRSSFTLQRTLVRILCTRSGWRGSFAPRRRRADPFPRGGGWRLLF